MRTEKTDYKHYWNFSKRRKDRLNEKKFSGIPLNLELKYMAFVTFLLSAQRPSLLISRFLIGFRIVEISHW